MVHLSVRGVYSFKRTRSTNRTCVGALGLNNQRSKVVCILPSFLFKSSFRLGRFFFLLPPPCLGARLVGRVDSAISPRQGEGYLAGDRAPVSRGEMSSGCHGLTNVVVEDMFNALLEERNELFGRERWRYMYMS